MIHPSYQELMAVVNQDASEDALIVESRYSIVKATAERAKQIIDARHIEEKLAKNPDKDKMGIEPLSKEEERLLKIGDPLIAGVDNVKPLSVAVDEINRGLVKIIPNAEPISEDAE